MKAELLPIDIRDVPELVRIAEEVRTTGEPRLLRGESDDVAVEIRVAPKTRKRTPRVPRGKPLTRDDSLWNIVGMASSGGRGDVSENKHKYLLEGYLATHR